MCQCELINSEIKINTLSKSDCNAFIYYESTKTTYC